MSRYRRPADPVREGQPRHYCAWIANPNYFRCPRSTRTGEDCWCRVSYDEYDRNWPWRVVPPLVTDPAAPAWTYDDVGPHPIEGREVPKEKK